VRDAFPEVQLVGGFATIVTQVFGKPQFQVVLRTLPAATVRWFDVQFPEFVVVTEVKMSGVSGNRGVSSKVPAYRRLLEFVFQGRDIVMLLKS
jgi:hypothetical protein